MSTFEEIRRLRSDYVSVFGIDQDGPLPQFRKRDPAPEILTTMLQLERDMAAYSKASGLIPEPRERWQIIADAVGSSWSAAPKAPAKKEPEPQGKGDRHRDRKEKRMATAKIEAFSSIEAEPIKWLWPHRVAIGKMSLFVGDPGNGKSQASLDLAARVSLGLRFPDGETADHPGHTLVLTSEDDPGDTIRPRLDALGADLTKIHFLRCKLHGDGKEDFPSLADVDVIRDAADQIRSGGGQLRLLIVDPLEGFLAGADAHKNTEVRAILAPIVALAAAEDFAVVGIQHLNKGGSSAAYRVGGSIAFTALARSVWVFCRDAENPDRRLFLCLKNNLGQDRRGLEYTIATAANGAPFIRWGAEVDDDIRDVLANDRPQAKKDHRAPEQDRVQDILKAAYPQAVRAKDIAGTIDKSPTATANILKKLVDRGLAKPAPGMYGFWLSTEPELSPPSTHLEGDEQAESDEALLPVDAQELEHSSDSLVSAHSMGIETDESSPVNVAVLATEALGDITPELPEEEIF